MLDVKVGGVPEHFNLPWYMPLADKSFQKVGLNLRWKDFPGGTGQMTKALRAGEIDIAVILTEGIIKDIVDGNPASIVQLYVKTPLVWGIHVAANSDYHQLADLKGTKAAISRLGSGSHLMAYINAENQGWDANELDFEIIQNLDGALENMPKGTGDYFLWEKYTTKPYVDNGIFRRIGECPTPWPCFVIAARNEFIEKHPNELAKILKIINGVTVEFKHSPGINKTISERYGQNLEDVQAWLSQTEWSQDQLPKNIVDDVQSRLKQLGLIEDCIPAKAILKNL